MDYSCVDVLYVLILMLLRRLLSGISIRHSSHTTSATTSTTFSALRSQTEWINQWKKVNTLNRKRTTSRRERKKLAIVIPPYDGSGESAHVAIKNIRFSFRLPKRRCVDGRLTSRANGGKAGRDVGTEHRGRARARVKKKYAKIMSHKDERAWFVCYC